MGLSLLGPSLSRLYIKMKFSMIILAQLHFTLGITRARRNNAIDMHWKVTPNSLTNFSPRPRPSPTPVCMFALDCCMCRASGST